MGSAVSNVLNQVSLKSDLKLRVSFSLDVDTQFVLNQVSLKSDLKPDPHLLPHVLRRVLNQVSLKSDLKLQGALHRRHLLLEGSESGIAQERLETGDGVVLGTGHGVLNQVSLKSDLKQQQERHQHFETSQF